MEGGLLEHKIDFNENIFLD